MGPIIKTRKKAVAATMVGGLTRRETLVAALGAVAASRLGVLANASLSRDIHHLGDGHREPRNLPTPGIVDPQWVFDPLPEEQR